jgi:hypothetical protein
MAGSHSKYLYDKQVLTPKDFYEFAQENIHAINYFYVSQMSLKLK